MGKRYGNKAHGLQLYGIFVHTSNTDHGGSQTFSPRHQILMKQIAISIAHSKILYKLTEAKHMYTGLHIITRHGLQVTIHT